MKTQPQQPEELIPQHIEIQNHLYKFRYLNRPQVQTLLNHKYWSNVIDWLNELSEKRYIAKDFKRKFAGVAAIYCLDKNSRKVLEGKEGIKIERLMQMVYGDKKRSRKFKYHNVLVSHIFLSLSQLVKKTKATLNFYTQSDLYKLKSIILPMPDAYFSIEEKDKTVKRYFLDIFDPLVNVKWTYKRVYQYFSYFDKEFWQNATGKKFPDIIMVCPDEEYKKDLERHIKKVFRKNSLADISFYLSTWEEIQTQGIKRETLHKVVII